ncbi:MULTISPECIES: D-2-hydroxyacid dehydrogenase family protein [unclassified Beijerinckia]|uniref:D-2-hydroxyacid dehydrogenase family protein n=1 Tax=unclassified Beijerinckia TaxID=2638183 RepID=UPI000895766B|nr:MULTISPECIES: D-2-hydroxyacid dehydrogenase family protein [unclassified Beijerinckia]MDH7799403.1 phosphoglycerate dehydrogenase-like enzyme [Beijerinckia sp. GAS462]SED49198.1 Lactate dehydrogenase [Beijerinckia sp. 28-YEA-48]
MTRIAVLDDYLDVVKNYGDWASLGRDCQVSFFRQNLASVEDAARQLQPFEVLSLMRERMPLSRALIEKLPNLKLVITTGGRNRSIDVAACQERGIIVCGTRSADPAPTVDVAWWLILSAARNLHREERHMRAGGWQEKLGFSVAGRTLGLIGFGNLGKRVAAVGKAFGMDIIAWSQNLTEEKAAAGGARLVSKEELLSQADVMSIHLVLSDRSRDLIGAREFGLMKPTAIVVNTSRGPIINEEAMIEALKTKRIHAIGLDVYNTEPLPSNHILRSFDNAVLSPHMGYATQVNYKTYYADTIEAIAAWRAGNPVPRVIESD